MPRMGKEFEQLVARIETLLTPLGAVVSSPDFIVDNVTGNKREVDASIRYEDGGTQQLITVECRDYKVGRQDVMWIEQLVTKRSNIGATKTIAVSSTGFSDAAVTCAAHHGIELRQMSTITDSEIASTWLEGFGAALVFPEFVCAEWCLLDENGDEITPDDLEPSISSALAEGGPYSPFIALKGISDLVSMSHLFTIKVPASEWIDSEGEVPITIEMSSKGDLFSVDTITGMRTISRLVCKYIVVKREVPFGFDLFSQYSSNTAVLMERLCGTADLGEVGFKADMLGRFSKAGVRAK